MAQPADELLSSAGRDLALHAAPDAERAAAAAADFAAQCIRNAISSRGRCSLAVSGGRSPQRMLELLAAHDLPWTRLSVFQVDERVAPAGDPARNASGLQQSLLARAPLPPERMQLMPVAAPDLDRAAGEYALALERECGTPPVLDLVHLGLGSDGHTASLFPGAPALDVRDADVVATDLHAGWRRLTLTLPALNRARSLLWLVTGDDKRRALAWLRAGTAPIPANRIRRSAAILFCDRAALGDASTA